MCDETVKCVATKLSKYRTAARVVVTPIAVWDDGFGHVQRLANRDPSSAITLYGENMDITAMMAHNNLQILTHRRNDTTMKGIYSWRANIMPFVRIYCVTLM